MECCLKVSFFIVLGISLVASFSWKDCSISKTTDQIRILSLDIYSNRTKVLYVTGRGKVAKNITEPISAKVDMKKKFFWGWTVIPCVDRVGSCDYEDICELSPYLHEPCPAEFTNNNLPCRCPFLQGQYSIKKFPVNLNILPQWIEEGKYRIQLTLYKENTELMCLLLNLTF